MCMSVCESVSMCECACVSVCVCDCMYECVCVRECVCVEDSEAHGTALNCRFAFFIPDTELCLSEGLSLGRTTAHAVQQIFYTELSLSEGQV